MFPDATPRVVERLVEPGDLAVIVEGPLRNLQALVTGVLPGRERVRVLFQLLGREIEIELSNGAVCPGEPAVLPVLARRRGATLKS